MWFGGGASQPVCGFGAGRGLVAYQRRPGGRTRALSGRANGMGNWPPAGARQWPPEDAGWSIGDCFRGSAVGDEGGRGSWRDGTLGGGGTGQRAEQPSRNQIKLSSSFCPLLLVKSFLTRTYSSTVVLCCGCVGLDSSELPTIPNLASPQLHCPLMLIFAGRFFAEAFSLSDAKTDNRNPHVLSLLGADGFRAECLTSCRPVL